MSSHINESLRCPTCNAEQAWSDECRRCKSDLRLLRRVAESHAYHRQRAMLALSAGHFIAALADARQAHELYPDESTLRLLATCQLLAGNCPEAVMLAQEERPTRKK